MKRLTLSMLTFGFLIIFCINVNSQYLTQQFTQALTAGNEGGGTTVSNAAVTSDPVYVNNPASNTQFTFLSTNNAVASISISGDGVMRLARAGSGTVYVVRNTDFTGSPTSLMVKFDFNAETTSGTSTSTIEFMVGQNFPNSNSNPASSDKHSLFFVNTKNPTGTPGTWGITPISGASTSAFTTTQTISWYINNSGAQIDYTGPNGQQNSVANDTYDLWVGDSLYYNDEVANSPTAALNHFEIRIAGGNGIYTVDNLLITDIPTGGGTPTVTDHFRTKQSGDWNAISTWEFSVDGNTWTDATVTPFDTSNTITIRNGHTVTVTQSVNVDQTTIEQGGAVIVEGTPVVFTISDGDGAVDMLVNGLLKSTGTANASPGPHTVNAQGVLQFGATGIYEHEQNAGAIPESVWGVGSTVRITGTTNTAPANRNQNYHHLIFDTPNNISNLNMGFSDNVISGNITIVNSGAGRWQLCGPTAGNSAIVDILGDVIHQNGNFSAHGTGNANTTIIINHYGNIIATAGNFSIARGSQAGTGTTDWFMFNGSITLSNLTTQNSNTAGARFVFTGTSEQNLVLTNLSYGGGGLPVIVDSGATVNLGSSVIEGNGLFTVRDFGGINTTQATGFEANLLTTGAVTLSTSGNYGYNGSIAQVTGTRVPSTINSLRVNNVAGVSLSGNMLVNGFISIISGDLDLNGNTLSLGSDASLSETPGNTVKGATGKLAITRNLNAPTGVNVGGLGAMITSSADLGSTLVERYHYLPTGNSNSGITRVFNIQPTNNSGLNAILRFYYDESEIGSIPESNLTLFKSPGGATNTWNGVGGTVNTSENYVELSGISDFSYWTLGDFSNPLPVELVAFNAFANNGLVKLTWTAASEINNRGWEIERKSSETEWAKVGFVEGSGNSTQSISYSFVDKLVTFGYYSYRLKQIDFDGTFAYSNVVEVDLGAGPIDFALNQNYPNPFNPTTVISFDLPQNEFVNLSIYNILGEKVATLINSHMEQGRYKKEFDASHLTSGIYIYRLTAGKVVLTKKMLLTK